MRPVHLEIRSRDKTLSQQFWPSVFGWSFKKRRGPFEYWGVTTGDDSDPGIHGGFMKSLDGQARFVPWIEVDDVDAVLASVVSFGGEIRVPKSVVPGVGDLAYCVAPDGNMFAIVRCTPKG